VAGDPYLNSDVVQAVKEGLIVDFDESNDSTEANSFDLSTPYFKLHEEFVLAPAL
jgi:hypothetical protein